MMLMLACVEAALTGVANSRVESMLMAGRILTNRNIVRRVGFVCLLIRLDSKIEDLSVSRYQVFNANLRQIYQEISRDCNKM